MSDLLLSLAEQVLGLSEPLLPLAATRFGPAPAIAADLPYSGDAGGPPAGVPAVEGEPGEDAQSRPEPLIPPDDPRLHAPVPTFHQLAMASTPPENPLDQGTSTPWADRAARNPLPKPAVATPGTPLSPAANAFPQGPNTGMTQGPARAASAGTPSPPAHSATPSVPAAPHTPATGTEQANPVPAAARPPRLTPAVPAGDAQVAGLMPSAATIDRTVEPMTALQEGAAPRPPSIPATADRALADRIMAPARLSSSATVDRGRPPDPPVSAADLAQEVPAQHLRSDEDAAPGQAFLVAQRSGDAGPAASPSRARAGTAAVLTPQPEPVAERYAAPKAGPPGPFGEAAPGNRVDNRPVESAKTTSGSPTRAPQPDMQQPTTDQSLDPGSDPTETEGSDSELANPLPTARPPRLMPPAMPTDDAPRTGLMPSAATMDRTAEPIMPQPSSSPASADQALPTRIMALARLGSSATTGRAQAEPGATPLANAHGPAVATYQSATDTSPAPTVAWLASPVATDDPPLQPASIPPVSARAAAQASGLALTAADGAPDAHAHAVGLGENPAAADVPHMVQRSSIAAAPVSLLLTTALTAAAAGPADPSVHPGPPAPPAADHTADSTPATATLRSTIANMVALASTAATPPTVAGNPRPVQQQPAVDPTLRPDTRSTADPHGRAATGSEQSVPVPAARSSQLTPVVHADDTHQPAPMPSAPNIDSAIDAAMPLPPAAYERQEPGSAAPTRTPAPGQRVAAGHQDPAPRPGSHPPETPLAPLSVKPETQRRPADPVTHVLTAEEPVVPQAHIPAAARGNPLSRRQSPSAPEPLPTIRVTIGRIDVRAAPPAPRRTAGVSRPAPDGLSLSDYLQAHAGDKP